MAKVLFIQDIVYEYFGVMHISSYLKEHGHECDVVVEYAEKDWLSKVDEFNPDIIAFSVLTGSFPWAIQRATMLKEKFKKPVIFGGVHVFLNPDKTIKEPCIDAVCTGEGEVSIKELCDAYDVSGALDQSIKGFWFKQPDGSVKKNPPMELVNDLDSLPFPDRSIYWKYPAIAKRTLLPVIGSRGCPYTCTYCFIPSAKKIFEGLGKFIRERSAENIIAEVEQCLEMSPVKEMVHFTEDHFGNNRQLTLKVVRAVSKLKNGQFKWGGSIRIERFNKEDYVKQLGETNHGLLGIAVECGDEDYRRDVLKRPVTNEQIIQAANLARKYGMTFTTLNMLGLPGETFDQALMTLDLNIKLRPAYANCYVYQPFPGTELQKYSVTHKLLDEKVVDQLGLSFYDRYWKTNRQLNQVINLQRIFGTVVTFPALKKPLVAMARNNWRMAVDVIFGFYYMWWLAHYYKITPPQILKLISLWVRNKFSANYHPSVASYRKGEGQLYTNVEKV